MAKEKLSLIASHFFEGEFSSVFVTVTSVYITEVDLSGFLYTHEY